MGVEDRFSVSDDLKLAQEAKYPVNSVVARERDTSNLDDFAHRYPKQEASGGVVNRACPNSGNVKWDGQQREGEQRGADSSPGDFLELGL